MVEMFVEAIGLDAITLNHIVILTDEIGEAFLPIVIGEAEATAIALIMEEIELPRPLTHDLLLSCIRELGGTLEKITITDLKDDTFYAQLTVRQAGQVIEIDSRPSDAIALALREDVPIYVAQKVLDKGSDKHPTIDDKEMADFRAFLDKITPEDFRKRSD
ncbi:MAG: bifunctional nuclease family protein [Firmicutes bacterium]|nr:bifunctional nuclease family protein [Bacillota bacterium]